MADQETPEELRARLEAAPVPQSAMTPEEGVKSSSDLSREFVDENQQGFVADLKDGFLYTTALGSGVRNAADEKNDLKAELIERLGWDDERGAPVISDKVLDAVSWVGAAVGFTHKGEEWDKASHHERLTTGIPSSYHDDIMSNSNLISAVRERERIMKGMEAQQRLGAQYDAVGSVAGSLVDIDAPLALFSGGGWGAAKVARTVAKNAKTVTGSARIAKYVSSVAQGAYSGTQGGAVAGAALAVNDPISDWTDIAHSTLGGLLLGTTSSALMPSGVSYGDPELAAQAGILKDDFEKQVAEDGPLVSNEPTDIEAMPSETPTVMEPTVIELDDPEVGEGTGGDAGAAQTVPLLPFTPVPLRGQSGNTPKEHATLSNNTQQWARDSGWNRRKAADAASSGMQKMAHWLATNDYVQLATGNSFFTTMYKSVSSTANWTAGTLFDSASGYGRGQATASMRMETYHGRIMGTLTHSRGLVNRWAQNNGYTIANGWLGVTSDGHRAFNRAVMLERDARSRGAGNAADLDRDVAAQADLYDAAAREAHGIGTGKDGETAVDGFENVPENPHYNPYNWDGAQINKLIEDGRTTLDAIKKALAQSYRDSGINGKDVDAIADAVIERARAGELDVDTSVYGLLNSEGQEWLSGVLHTKSNLPAHEVEAIMDRLVGDRSEGSKEGFAKRRNDVDMSTVIPSLDGSDIRVVDLLSQDLNRDWLRYSRRMAGSAALARHGVTNRRQRLVVAETIAMEQQMAGETPTPINETMAMFTHFDGGAVKGFSTLTGKDMQEVGHGISLMKKMANLAYLGKLGLTQAGETGMIIAHTGMQSFYNRGLKPVFDKGMADNKAEFVKEIGFLTGSIGLDHKVFQEHLSMDDFSTDDLGMLGKLNKLASNASQAQSYLSLFNTVRSWQQTTAASAVSDTLFRKIKEYVDQGKAWDESFLQKSFDDLGLDQAQLNELSILVETGVIEFDATNGFVNRMNVDQWSVELQEVFGTGVMRNINQLVQKAVAGEQDAWMHTSVGSIMTHLKTFPMSAVNKQLIRHMRSGNVDNVAIAAVLYGLGTATVAAAARSAMNGTLEDDMQSGALLRKGFMYSNMTGWTSNYYDPLMVMLGLEGYAVNPYADRQGIQPPILSWAEDAWRLPGAAAAAVAGTAGYKDKTALKTLPFSNILLWSNVLGNVGKEGSVTARNTAKAQRARAKAEKPAEREWGAGTAPSETPPPGLTYEDIDGSLSGSTWADGTPYKTPTPTTKRGLKAQLLEALN